MYSEQKNITQANYTQNKHGNKKGTGWHGPGGSDKGFDSIEQPEATGDKEQVRGNGGG